MFKCFQNGMLRGKKTADNIILKVHHLIQRDLPKHEVQAIKISVECTLFTDNNKGLNWHI